MKKIIFSIILITLSLGLIIYQTIIIRKLGTSLKQVNSINEAIKNEKDVLTENLILHWKNENGKIADSIIWDENFGVISKSILISKGPVLIFRFSEFNCKTCIDELLKLINDRLHDKHINFIVVGNFQNSRALSVFKSVKQLNCPIYNSKKLVTNESITPYFFILSEDGTISELFYPDNLFPVLSSKYIEIIEEKYFSNTIGSSFTSFEK
ncbi:MAG: hypothetical protein NT144_13765 [Bacteroidia bacterium]|nr:hypothetical protein [Bacteroidia bacterium]